MFEVNDIVVIQGDVDSNGRVVTPPLHFCGKDDLNCDPVDTFLVTNVQSNSSIDIQNQRTGRCFSYRRASLFKKVGTSGKVIRFKQLCSK